MYVGLLVAAGLAGFVALVLPASYDGERVRRRIRAIAGVAAGGRPRSPPCCRCPLASVYAQGQELSDAGQRRSTRPWSSTRRLSALLVMVGLGRRGRDPHRPGARRRSAGSLLLAGAVGGAARTGRWSATPAPTSRRRCSRRRRRPPRCRRHLARRPGRAGPHAARARRPRAARRDHAGPLLHAGRRACCSPSPPTGSVLAWRILGSWSAFVDTALRPAAAGQDRARAGGRRRSAAGTGSGCCPGSGPPPGSPTAAAPRSW